MISSSSVVVGTRENKAANKIRLLKYVSEDKPWQSMLKKEIDPCCGRGLE